MPGFAEYGEPQECCCMCSINAAIVATMIDPIADFVADVERGSAQVGMTPIEVLRAAGFHQSMWARWTRHGISPTLRTAHVVREKLKELAERRGAAA